MPAATQQATRNVITLKGSTQLVTEFFEYAVSSILFQRGIYPPEYFQGIKKYGMHIMVTHDPELDNYLKTISEQMHDWVAKGQLQKMALMLTSMETNEVLERWTFKVDTDKCIVDGLKPLPEKSEKDIHKEIAAIIRQITASVTFLPLLEEPCTFDLLIYTDKDADVPDTWGDSEERPIANATDVELRAFSTKVHEVSTTVTYKQVESDNEGEDTEERAGSRDGEVTPKG